MKNLKKISLIVAIISLSTPQISDSLDSDGFNRDGYDKVGYNKDGYDKKGHVEYIGGVVSRINISNVFFGNF